jgi:hypothetical protein
MRQLLGPAVVVVNGILAACWGAFDPTWCYRAQFLSISIGLGALAIFLMGYAYWKLDQETAKDRRLWMEIHANSLLLLGVKPKSEAAAAEPNSLKSRAYTLAVKIREFLEQQYAERGSLTIKRASTFLSDLDFQPFDPNELPRASSTYSPINAFLRKNYAEYTDVRNLLRAQVPESRDALFSPSLDLPRYDHDLFQIAAGLERMADRLP